jgi:hypothetical protein
MKWNIGNKNGMWKGGRSIASNGYVLIRLPKHHLADKRGYVYEHRLIAEQKLGRRLKKGEVVHHKDHNRLNNTYENIEVHQSIKHHLYVHRRIKSDKRKPSEENPFVSCECGCGAGFLKYDKSNRPRKYISGHNITKKVRIKDHVKN